MPLVILFFVGGGGGGGGGGVGSVVVRALYMYGRIVNRSKKEEKAEYDC